jgi:hypothetical protein
MTARRLGIALLVLPAAAGIAGCHAHHGCQVCQDPSLRRKAPAHVWVPIDAPARTLDNPDASAPQNYVGVPLTPYGRGRVVVVGP